ncbi:hypothetical protein EST92_11790 [Streptomyces sp. TM32]|uniref:hypothetical protein n=1 Tax=Streptomyces sp. TM32 TaxID=1652669 RepID=UPI001010768A|nr:hypothetical protein [Streptomyces sp. TM32]RXS84233.1 hypothetical protein EST92_11790 [Streptomyces sp. TM32]
MATPTPVEPMSAGPACALCGEPAVVQWRRRLTDEEFAQVLEAEQERRDEATLLADPAQPPVFGPMPQPSDYTTAVYACADHGIGIDLAALVHRKTCTAPQTADLPECDCTPEPPPPPDEELIRTAAPRLPAGWHTA